MARRLDRIPLLVGLWALAAAVQGATPGEWSDCLARAPAPGDGALVRVVEGQWVVQTGAETDWSTVPLCDVLPEAFEVEIELRWTPREKGQGGMEVALGPHGIGSGGYRLVAQREPWRTAECSGWGLAARQWHRLCVQGDRAWLACRLDGQFVASAAVQDADDLALAVGPATEVAVRECRVRRAAPPPGERPVRFVYPAARFIHRGRVTADAAAQAGEAVELEGAGLERWLLGGQDGSLPAGGDYEARFGLRCVAGSGRVRLAVARAGREALALTHLSAAELPVKGYRQVAVPFRYAPGTLLEYRVALDAESRVRADAVEVVRATRQEDKPSRSAPRACRKRRPPPLEAVWSERPRESSGAGLETVRLERRMAPHGAYRVRVVWRQGRAEPMDGVALDLWVSCRDEWGIVRTFDYGVVCDDVPPGLHVTAAELDGVRCRRYGVPGALLVQLSVQGRPVASAWRKWGIPVDDKWILPAERIGRLRAVSGR